MGRCGLHERLYWSPVTAYASFDCNDNGIPDTCDIDCGPPGAIAMFRDAGVVIGDRCDPEGIPTVSVWGLMLMTLLGLVAGTIFFARRCVRA